MSQRIPRLVDEALDRAGLGHLRRTRSFLANTGDGVVFGFPTTHLPSFLWPFLNVLQDVLGTHAARGGGPRVRLRAVVHVGPLPGSGDPGAPGDGDGNGIARNEAHRLLDAQPLRQALAESDAETTHLAVIISQRVYQDVVLGGYTALPPKRCTEVVATVEGKEFQQPAWLYVPSPSGNLLVPPREPGPARTDCPPPELLDEIDRSVSALGSVCGQMGDALATYLRTRGGHP
ncbi:hypothetical protein [Streptomyces sp. 6N223]|uniref:hypothetical protein n=1 Tax=Streptomyces sp. 6N223 TaxID=3457412 RepID=UPI003FD3A4EC